ncbi:MAG: alpha/beta fold hydrolase [Bacteroidota bacterium]
MTLKNQVLSRTGKKTILYDVFIKEDEKKKPLVIFCHGYKGFKDWGVWDLVANHFKSAGCLLVKFNFSHNGGTVENPIDFPDLEAFAENNYTKELDDLEDMLSFLLSDKFEFSQQINQEKVNLIGHSRGGGICIIKASEDDRINKLITWASVADFGRRSSTTGDLEQWRKDGVKYVLNGRTKQQMPHNFQFYDNFKANEKRLHIESSERQLAIPHLIIHGKEDDAVLFSEAEELHDWGKQTELFPVDGANHVFNSKHPWDSNIIPEALEIAINKSLSFISS